MRSLSRELLKTYEPKILPPEDRVPAAVLLLLYERGGEEHLLFQVRTQHVEHHKGEISLPGGAQDPGDESLLHTALRETHEEIGVQADHVEIFGRLDDVPTRTNFTISPFVGAIKPTGDYPFRHAEIEVEMLLEVPLPHLLSEDCVEWTPTPFGTQMRAFHHGEHLIFGATARIVGQFVDMLGEGLKARDAGTG